MQVWFTDEAFPASVATRDAADQAGAELISYGIPAKWTNLVPAGTVGLYDVQEIVPAHVPLDAHGQLVTLLVVVGALTLDDAEHVAGPGVTAADLIAEAEAWSLGGA